MDGYSEYTKRVCRAKQLKPKALGLTSMKIITKLSIIVIICLLSAGCSWVNTIDDGNDIFITKCANLDLVFSPSDSTLTYIFSPYGAFQDSTIINMFKTGIITANMLHTLRHDSTGWAKYSASSSKVHITLSEDCFNTLPKKEMEIYELIDASSIMGSDGRRIYSFEIIYDHGTIREIYKFKINGNSKYALRSAGAIL